MTPSGGRGAPSESAELRPEPSAEPGALRRRGLRSGAHIGISGERIQPRLAGPIVQSVIAYIFTLLFNTMPGTNEFGRGRATRGETNTQTSPQCDGKGQAFDAEARDSVVAVFGG